MIEVVWFFPVIWIAVTAGIAIALSSWIVYDKHREKRLMRMVQDPDYWCSDNCKNYDWCFSNYKDPDDALDALEDFCIQCPMRKALEEYELKQRKGDGK